MIVIVHDVLNCGLDPRRFNAKKQHRNLKNPFFLRKKKVQKTKIAKFFALNGIFDKIFWVF